MMLTLEVILGWTALSFAVGALWWLYRVWERRLLGRLACEVLRVVEFVEAQQVVGGAAPAQSAVLPRKNSLDAAAINAVPPTADELSV